MTELLRQTIRPEFLNRIDEIILFQPLLKGEIKGIIRIQLEDLQRLVAKNGINLEFSDYADRLPGRKWLRPTVRGPALKAADPEGDS